MSGVTDFHLKQTKTQLLRFMIVLYKHFLNTLFWYSSQFTHNVLYYIYSIFEHYYCNNRHKYTIDFNYLNWIYRVFLGRFRSSLDIIMPAEQFFSIWSVQTCIAETRSSLKHNAQWWWLTRSLPITFLVTCKTRDMGCLVRTLLLNFNKWFV
jgi:hypothetical protein